MSRILPIQAILFSILLTCFGSTHQNTISGYTRKQNGVLTAKDYCENIYCSRQKCKR